ncbi:MAG TPA: tetratricopeptide repeat protein [Verrucomicrobiae bacterium]|nr:tetratricopeptide repeat protein [Verrucomicrobiae bacterium]
MIRTSVLLLIALMAFTQRAPAPLVYTPGEGWHYEAVGEEGSWTRARPKDQLDVALQAFQKHDFSTAAKAAKRTVTRWPYSDYASQAQYLVARCYEENGKDEKAFKAYQKLLERYPKIDNYNEIIQRQFIIANRFLAGEWFKLWDFIPVFPSMDRTIKMYEQIIKNGLYSEVAPEAQMNIGHAYELKFVRDYPAAAKAYERAADRYSDRSTGADALFKVGLAYNRQAKTAEYDQSVASHAISVFTDFMTLHPDDKRSSDAQKIIASLRTEQARGSYEIARFYEHKNRPQAALIYYNEVLLQDPGSTYADDARRRIDSIKREITTN